jgi:hypothetical protein
MQVTIDAPDYDVHDFVIKDGATEPALVATLRDDDGNAVDLTGASVEFRMKQAGADALKVDDACLVTDSSGGEVTYEWSASDTDTVGHYNAEFAVDYSGETGNNFAADEYFPSDEYLSIRVMSHL